MSRNPQAFLDITIGTTPAGRVVFELFVDLTPKTAENFKGLCTGDYGISKISQKKLSYIGSRFFKIINGLSISGGDITKNDGSGGESIYGKTFNDENFDRRHACAGLLCMANKGPNTNSSIFYITLRASPQFDNKNVVFGKVIKGMEVVRAIAKQGTDQHDRPVLPILIVNAGEVGDQRLHLKKDVFLNYAAGFRLDKEENERMRSEREEAIFKKVNPNEKNETGEKEETDNPKKDDQIEKEDNKLDFDPNQEEEEEESHSKLTEEQKKKFYEFNLMMNEARKQNNAAVQEENTIICDPKINKKRKTQEWFELVKQEKEDLVKLGASEDKGYLHDTMLKCRKNVKREKQKANKNIVFGWNVFNEDSLYNAYFKRTQKLEDFKKKGIYNNPANEIVTTELSQEKLQLLVDDVYDIEKRREDFKRTRMYMQGDLSYISERNKVFNEKLDRHYQKYSIDYKKNLERGSKID